MGKGQVFLLQYICSPPMYKVLPFTPETTNPAMLQEILNGLAGEGYDLKQIVQFSPVLFVAVLSTREQHERRTSFGPLE